MHKTYSMYCFFLPCSCTKRTLSREDAHDFLHRTLDCFYGSAYYEAIELFSYVGASGDNKEATVAEVLSGQEW